MKLKQLMNIIPKIYREFVGLYLSNLSLPMVFKPNSKLTVVFILVMVFLSVLFNLGIYKHFNSGITYMLVFASIFNLFFLKFNFIVRFYNVFFKSIIYFYSVYKNVGLKKSNKFKVLIFYYLYNIMCFIFTYFLVVRIQNNLFEFSYSFGEYSQIYSYVLSPVLSLMYIDYISEDSVLYKQILLNKFGKIIHFIIIGLIAWSLVAVIDNLFILKPILCEPTGSENNQVNQNTQNGDHATNEQTNGNNQITRLENNTPTSSRIYNTNQRQIVQTNNQGNVNNQIFKGKTPTQGLSRMIRTDSNGFLIQTNRQINVNNQIISNDLTDSNSVVQSGSSSSAVNEVKLTKKEIRNLLPDDGIVRKKFKSQLINNTVIVSNKVNALNKLLPLTEAPESSISLFNSNCDIKNFSFMEAFEALKDLKDIKYINDIQYKNNLNYLLTYASQQDVNNNILTFAKQELLDNPNNINIFLLDQLIYMNNKYSIIVVVNKFDTYVTLNLNGYNIANLQENNIEFKCKLSKDLKLLITKNKALNFGDTSKKIIDVKRQIKACDRLNEILVNRFGQKIGKVDLNYNTMIDLLSSPADASYSHPLKNKFIYWKKLELFTFEFYKEYYVISANSRVKLFNYVYSDYIEAKQKSIRVGDPKILFYEALLDAIRKYIPNLNIQSVDNEIADQMIEPYNSFNIFNFDKLERDFPSNPPSVREIEVTSRRSDDSSDNHPNNNVERTNSNIG